MHNPSDFHDIYLELHGEHSLYIENFRKLAKYTKEEITVLTAKGSLLITGSSLYIKKYTKEEIFIEGLITNIIRLS